MIHFSVIGGSRVDSWGIEREYTADLLVGPPPVRARRRRGFESEVREPNVGELEEEGRLA